MLILVTLRYGLLGWGPPAIPAKKKKKRSPEFITSLDIWEALPFLEEPTEHGS